ncbi:MULTISPECIES: response regulator [Aliiglaciecola]|uniref:response regulator n=1 Tax=Aliiglaciecola TaxID=1406885 RepID=UPI001C089668|nr:MULTISPECIES: response regulator [Aliiglaciecola]MBU2877659.1 response regulator [Aliiglaciecola lipolytica]MDO6713393.1 response regulator [Aliiglaciecola sp. 2_MG-2023]MDO6754527.1 response regulator [Aliiglaciecola sp. 1_MG-2023]
MTTPKILIIEDEENIAEVLIAYCKQQGYATEHFDRGSGVVNFVKHTHVDFILLDLMLPEVDGITICKEIRKFSNVPIIMITAKIEEVDRLRGLNLGADDYICKPFSPKEIIARIQAVLRRVAPPKTNVIQQSGFELYKDDFVALFKGNDIGFTAVEFKIFLLFISHVGRVFTREDIINKIYNHSSDMSDRNIDTHIKNIRKKINEIEAGLNPISAVYGVGYKFKGE